MNQWVKAPATQGLLNIEQTLCDRGCSTINFVAYSFWWLTLWLKKMWQIFFYKAQKMTFEQTIPQNKRFLNSLIGSE